MDATSKLYNAGIVQAFSVKLSHHTVFADLFHIKEINRVWPSLLTA